MFDFPCLVEKTEGFGLKVSFSNHGLQIKLHNVAMSPIHFGKIRRFVA